MDMWMCAIFCLRCNHSPYLEMICTNAAKCWGFFENFKGCHCFYHKHWEQRQKKQRSNIKKKEKIPKNRKIMYQGNTYFMLDQSRKMYEEHAGRKKQSEKEQSASRNQTTSPNWMNLTMEPHKGGALRGGGRNITKRRMKCIMKISQCSKRKVSFNQIPKLQLRTQINPPRSSQSIHTVIQT